MAACLLKIFYRPRELIIASLILASSDSHAKLPACDAAGLTKNCDVFRGSEKTENIQYPDGTFLKKPIEKLPVKPTTNPDDAKKRLESRVRLLQFWRSLPAGARPSDDFQLSFNQAVPNPTISAVLGAEPGRDSASPLLLPWPPQNSSADLQVVSEEKLRSYFNSLEKPARAKLADLISVASVDTLKVSNPAAKPTMELAEKRALRVRELFEFARNALIDEVERGRSIGQLSEAERSQVARLKTVDFVSLQDAKEDPSCARMAPDAFYSGEGHRIVICPGMYSMPDSTLMEVLGHEVAHAIDPCTLQIPLVEVVVGGRTPEVQKTTNADHQMFLKDLKYAGSSGRTLVTSVLGSGRRDAAAFLVNSGASKLVAAAIPFDKYPEASVYKCLIQNAGVREVSASDINRIAEQYVRNLDGNWKEQNSKLALKQAKATLNRYPQCTAPNSGKGQMGEAMSDAWSSKILGRWLSKNPPRNDLERFAPMGMFLTRYCEIRRPGSVRPTSGEILDIGVDALSRVHPYARERAEKIFLTASGLQEALGCQPVHNFSCPDMLGRKPSKKFKRPMTNDNDSKLNSSGAQ